MLVKCHVGVSTGMHYYAFKENLKDTCATIYFVPDNKVNRRDLDMFWVYKKHIGFRSDDEHGYYRLHDERFVDELVNNPFFNINGSHDGRSTFIKCEGMSEEWVQPIREYYKQRKGTSPLDDSTRYFFQRKRNYCGIAFCVHHQSPGLRPRRE